MGRRARTIFTGLAIFAAVAVVGLSTFAVLLSSWSEVRAVSPAEAEGSLDAAVSRAGGGPPYLEISPEGTVRVRRDQEQSPPVPLQALRVLIWQPTAGRLVQVAFPFWFVQLKTTDTVNLGTLVAAVAQDWESIDLRVTEEDLQRRGPGLILDHRTGDGSRLVLLTE